MRRLLPSLCGAGALSCSMEAVGASVGGCSFVAGMGFLGVCTLIVVLGLAIAPTRRGVGSGVFFGCLMGFFAFSFGLLGGLPFLAMLADGATAQPAFWGSGALWLALVGYCGGCSLLCFGSAFVARRRLR